MTRKDYVALAKAINAVRKVDLKPGFSNSLDFQAGVNVLTGAIAQVLKNDNPRFDVERFYKAVEA